MVYVLYIKCIRSVLIYVIYLLGKCRTSRSERGERRIGKLNLFIKICSNLLVCRINLYKIFVCRVYKVKLEYKD